MNLKKGVNLGGFLSQCVHSYEHYDSFIGCSDIEKIADWGFDHVRLPIDSEVVENEDGTYSEKGFGYIDQTIEWCKKFGLSIILDIHKVAGYDFNNANDSEKNNLFHNEALQSRFLNLWKTIAQKYHKYDFVAFELLNEVVETKNADSWNALIARAVQTIRQVAPTSIIIYGGIEWNSAARIPQLEKPLDENIMFTFHYYEPLLFTHQKAPWVPAMDPNETIPYTDDMDWFREKSKKLGQQGHTVVDSKVSSMGLEFHEEFVQDALEYCKKIGVKLYCGEFGVIDRAPASDTLKWVQDVAKMFHKYEIGFSIWSYKKMDFGIADEHYDAIREEMLEALLK